MPKESNLEFKVGLFVFLGFLALTIFVFSISDTSVFEKGKTIRVIFNFANGLKQNAPVRIAGVDEGIVKNISLFFDSTDSHTKAEVQIRIKKDTRIPVDSSIMINQLGFLGEKYVEIVPGTDTKNFLKEDEAYFGKDPVSQEMIVDRIMQVAKNLEGTSNGFNNILKDTRNIKSIGEVLENLSLLTGSLNEIAADVKKGRGTVGKLFYDDRLYEDIEGLAADLKTNPWKLLYKPKGLK